MTKRKNVRRRRKILKFAKPWVHTGGGCSFAAQGKYFCDDEYRNNRTGEIVVFSTTLDMHFEAPERIRKPSDFLRRVGVGRIVARYRDKDEN